MDQVTTCKHCGSACLPGDRFCGYCGRPITSKKRVYQVGASRFLPVSLVLWILALAALVFSGVLYLVRDSQSLTAVAQSPPRLSFAPYSDERIRIIPYDGVEYSLHDLVAWSEPMRPGVYQWRCTIEPNTIVRIGSGWCAEAGLYQENLDNIEFSYTLDGQEIPLDELAIGSYSSYREGRWGDELWFCRSFRGLITFWTPGTHRYIETRRHLDDIFDGQSFYPEGDYVEEYVITVREQD